MAWSINLISGSCSLILTTGSCSVAGDPRSRARLSPLWPAELPAAPVLLGPEGRSRADVRAGFDAQKCGAAAPICGDEASGLA